MGLPCPVAQVNWIDKCDPGLEVLNAGIREEFCDMVNRAVFFVINRVSLS
jgi:hypothetical protein